VIGTLNVMFAVGEIDRDIHRQAGGDGERSRRTHIEEGWLDHACLVTLFYRPDAARVVLPPVEGAAAATTSSSPHLGSAVTTTSTRASSMGGGEGPRQRLDDRLATRLDYGAVFGTVLNRFAIRRSSAFRYGRRRWQSRVTHREGYYCGWRAENPEQRRVPVFSQATARSSWMKAAKIVASHHQAAPHGSSTSPRVEIEDTTNVTHTALEPSACSRIAAVALHACVRGHRLGTGSTDLLDRQLAARVQLGVAILTAAPTDHRPGRLDLVDELVTGGAVHWPARCRPASQDGYVVSVADRRQFPVPTWIHRLRRLCAKRGW
jgi:hypothetical protein